MSISVFDLFKIGIGPSSSHTVGPMRAAQFFCMELENDDLLGETVSVRVELYGSLGSTGKGHGSDIGVILGLAGYRPDTVVPDFIPGFLDDVAKSKTLMLCGLKSIVFDVARDIAFFREALPEHPNSMKIHAYDSAGLPICSSTYFSVGGGFVVRAGSNPEPSSRAAPIPHAFKSGVDLLAMTRSTGKSIAELVYENELSMRSADAIHDGLSRIWAAMRECVDRGCSAEGRLQGPLGVKRRAKSLFQKLKEDGGNAAAGPHAGMDWLNLFALAVNEENAGGGRVVTAPTNGAAGIIPAVLHYYVKFIPGADFEGVKAFLLTSAAIGALYKLNASISGAEVGCQGEVGVACSMAAAGFCAVLGGTPEQVENAAEIAMEHNLGLTCDPVGGRVQIPCIERNAMGAVKALNAAQMALHGNGTHYVSLDAVIRTMMQTGADMKTKYKETSKGGLAVNIIEC